MVADSNLLPGKLLRSSDRRFWRNHDAARRRNIRLAPHRADLLRGCLIDRPVTGAGDVGPHALVAAGPLVGFECARADLRNRAVGVQSFGALHRKAVPELVVQAFIPEIALCTGNPRLQAAVRLNDKFGHAYPPEFSCSPRAMAGKSAAPRWRLRCARVLAASTSR